MHLCCRILHSVSAVSMAGRTTAAWRLPHGAGSLEWIWARLSYGGERVAVLLRIAFLSNYGLFALLHVNRFSECCSQLGFFKLIIGKTCHYRLAETNNFFPSLLPPKKNQLTKGTCCKTILVALLIQRIHQYYLMSILKEINPKYSLEGLMLKLKL